MLEELRVPDEPPMGSVVRLHNGDEYIRSFDGWTHPRSASSVQWAMLLALSNGAVNVLRRGKPFPTTLMVAAEGWYWIKDKEGRYCSVDDAGDWRTDQEGEDERFADEPIPLKIVPHEQWMYLLTHYRQTKDDPDRARMCGFVYDAIERLIRGADELPDGGV